MNIKYGGNIMAKDKYEFHKECVKLREKEEKLYPINKVGYNIQKSNSHTYIKYMINIWTRNDYVFKEILLMYMIREIRRIES